MADLNHDNRNTPSKTPRKKILIVCPHPDDAEMLAHQFCVHGIQANYEVHELLTCCDEYGTERNKFKGKRIQKIRRNEMIEAAKVYGIDQGGNSLIKLHWANYIDCHVPFNSQSVKRFYEFIVRLNPDIIVGPDPFIQLDAHPDHINTGLNYYYALKKIHDKNSSKLPKLKLFFQSTKPDFFLPIRRFDLVTKARSKHRSQFTPFQAKILILINIIFNIFTAPKASLKFVEGFRRVKFDRESNTVKGLSQTIFYYILGKPGMELEHLVPPTPEELGLNCYPEGRII